MNNNNCESCAGGTDLPPGATCSVCHTTRKIVGYRKYEYPMCESDERNDIPITRLSNNSQRSK